MLARSRILEDYDPSKGGLLAFGVLLMLLAPRLTHALRCQSAR